MTSGSERPGPQPEVIPLLRLGKLRLLGLLPRASNYTFLAEIQNNDHNTLAVYKPRAGETPLWDFPKGTLCNREVAAYVLATALGWPAVPPTVMRDGPHGPGSVQLFVQTHPHEHYFTLAERSIEPFRPVAAFDIVANNADRKGGHCLLGLDGTIWVVDHGVCFSDQPKLRTVIWDFAGDPIPASLGEDLRRVTDELRSGTLRQSMLELLTGSEVDAIARRAERLVRSGCFPRPESDRPFPWPPV